MQSLLTNFLRSLRHIHQNNITSFVQKGALALIQFDAGDGTRSAVVYTSQLCPMRLQETDVEGVGVEIIVMFLDRPTTLHVNICALDSHVCFNCGASGQKLKYCQKCRDVNVPTRYCSRGCQVAHWPRHAALCG